MIIPLNFSVFLLFFSFVTGDIKFLCTILGHQGSKATHHCFLCTGRNYLEGGEKRTLKEWENQVEKIKDKICSKKVKKSLIVIDKDKDLGSQLIDYTSKYGSIFIENKNVFSKPLLDVKLENVVIPPLHIISGILNLIRRECEVVDELKYVSFKNLLKIILFHLLIVG